MIEFLRSFHPLIIEGMGGYDKREPQVVSSTILDGLRKYWLERPPAKSLLLVTQGDPYEERGVSAITRLVSDELDIPRALIFLDPYIADYHRPSADRYNLIFEIPFSSMSRWLEEHSPNIMAQISEQVRVSLAAKNALRSQEQKPFLPQHFFDFAMLQEVTKIACKQICGGVTIAHTSQEISPFSVTSFFEVGLTLGFIGEEDIISFSDKMLRDSPS
jgi:hypothetical protein